MINLSFSINYCCSQAIGDMTKAQEDIRTAASNINQTVQPYIIVIGPLESIKEIYVCMDTTIYKVASVLEAVSVCFYSFHVFNLQYPKASEHIWLLIQKGLYKFTTKEDAKSPYMDNIIDKVKKFAKADVENACEIIEESETN